MRSLGLLWRSHILLLCLATLLLGLSFAVYCIYADNLIRFPFDYDQGEGFELVDTVLFSQGQWPYQDTSVYPFYSSNYPPLFHIIAAPFVWLFGPAYWYGRLLGFSSTLLTAALIGYAVHRETRHRWIALLAGGAYLASNTVYHIGPLFRQHITMVLFETLAVVLLAHVNEIKDPRRRRWHLALALVCIVAAGYTKQLAAVTALALSVFLFIRQPRRAVVWCSSAALLGGLIFVGLNWATQGEWWRQAILANANELKILQSIALFRQWFGLHGFLIVPSVLVVLHQIYFDRLSIYALWFGAATALNGLASGTWGGGDSYFATAIAALCILSGIFAGRTLKGDWEFAPNRWSRWFITPFQRYAPHLRQAGLLIIPLLYIGYGIATLHLPTDRAPFDTLARLFNVQPNAQNAFYDSARTADGQYATGYAAIGHLVTAEDHAAGWQIVERIRQTQKPVISEDAGFSIMAGRTVLTNPTQLLNLDQKGLYQAGDLIPLIEAQAFDLIIFRAQFYPTSVLVAITTHYEQTEAIVMNGFEYRLLRPKVP